jgi:hypothetical protein
LDPSNQRNPHNGKYIFPEPGIFASVTNEAWCAKYFATWEHVRAICLFRVFSASSTAIPLSGQEQRDLLIGNLNRTLNGEKNQAVQRKIQDIFANCLTELSVDFDMFTPTNIVPPPVIKSEAWRVLWELSELNFCFELLALDKQASKITKED